MNTVFRTPGAKAVESYPVAIFDGSGSMYEEYESAVQAYFDVFTDERKGMKEFQYQFSEDRVYNLLPYQEGAYGNITQTFLTVFEQLLSNKDKLPKSLTIIFVSDGREQFNLKELEAQIEVMKQNFFISFISLAVGDSFPLSISNDLREALHNQKKSIQSIFTAQRIYNREATIIKEDFLKIFKSIKELSIIQEGQVILNQPVQLSLISEPTNVVPSNTVVLSKVPNVEIKTDDGKTLEPSKDRNDTFQLIEISVQEAFIQGNHKDIKEQMKIIQKEAEEVLQSKQIKKDENIVQLDTKILQVLELVDDIADGNLKVDKLTEDQKTKIQEAVMSEEKSLQDEVIKYVEVVSDPKKLNAGVVSKRISEKYKQVGCYVRGKKSQIQQNLSKLEQAFIVMKDTLQNCIQVVESNPQQDVIQLLTEYKNQTFISLNKVFQDQEFKIEKEDEIVMLKQMNELFELIHKVTIKQVSPNDFVSTVKAIKQTQQSNQSEDTAVSMTIFNSDADFNFLPQELRLLVKEEIDLEEAQKVFILIVDQNPCMNQESDVAIQRFQQQFKDVPDDKKLIITWKEKQFYLHKDQNVQQQQQIVQGIKFDTLFKCLSSVEQEYDLKNRRLFLCLVSDGETEYLSLHREFKVIKFHYSIQLIYLAVGRKLFARIENELKQKYAMRNVKGAPELINIPRSLVVSTNAGQKIGEQFSQKFENLVKKVLG